LASAARAPDDPAAFYNDPVDRQQLEEVARGLGIELLVQFGSTVTGTSHAGSDLDLAILFGRAPQSIADTADAALRLQALEPNREVDIAVLNHADPLLMKQVTDRGVLLFGDPSRWQAFRLYAFKRYQDHQRFLRMEREYVRRAVAAARR
jgi:predicted nucleotidyltransferase